MLENLEPKKVFQYFEEICSIPHGSGNVDAISDYLVEFAKKWGLWWTQDELKNIIIIKEASEGKEDRPAVMIQGHMDMVAVKEPDADLDMTKDGLRLGIDGDYVYARDTSLGGDDGIALAYGLALLSDESISHPRIELVITTEEEVGMEGATGIDLLNCCNRLEKEMQSRFSATDPECRVVVDDWSAQDKEGKVPLSCLNAGDCKKILAFLSEAPNGVQAMCEEPKGLVQTSLNLGIMKLEEDGLQVSFSLRSSVAKEKEELKERVSGLIEKYKGVVTATGDFTSWEYINVKAFWFIIMSLFDILFV